MMKKFILPLALLLIACNVWGQVESPVYKTAAEKFKQEYNLNRYDTIFTMFSAEMQTALPLNKAFEFFTGLNTQAGKITKMEFVKYEMQTYASYKTTFEMGLYLVNISVDNESKINGLFFKPYKATDLPKIDRNTTSLLLPFNETWNVFWGGDTKEQNYHVANEAQKNAFDFLIKDKLGKSYKTDGKTNEDFYAFGMEVLAPCNGEIVLVIDGIKENIPGEMNSFDLGGNTIILKTANNEYLVFCHLKHKSIKVTEGQKITAGESLGLCGNTGHSSEPHLHFHIQNVEDINQATGVKCYFSKIIVNGQPKNDYSPVKNESISNEK
jgi:hypothetical protein